VHREAAVRELARRELLASVELLARGLRSSGALPALLQEARNIGGVACIVGLPWGLPLARALAAELPRPDRRQEALLGALAATRRHIEASRDLDREPEGLGPWLAALRQEGRVEEQGEEEPRALAREAPPAPRPSPRTAPPAPRPSSRAAPPPRPSSRTVPPPPRPSSRQTPPTPRPSSRYTPPAPHPSAREAPTAALWGAFEEETTAQLGALQDGLLLLEASPGRLEQVEGLMRAAHSLKGAARVVQIEPLLALAHAMEDVFLAIQRGASPLTSPRVDLLLDAVDLTSELIRQARPGQGGLTEHHERQTRELVARLQQQDTPERAPRRTGPGPAPGTDDGGPEPEARALQVAAEGAPEDRGARVVEGEGRVVRVTAEMADRLLGLAGESVVEAQRIKPTSSALVELRLKQAETLDLAQSLVGSLRIVEEDPRMAMLVAELAANVSECQQLVLRAGDLLEEHARRASEVATRLYNDVLGSRMRPLRDRTRGLPRMARDVAVALGKQVRLTIRGEETLVDRDILEKIEAPLGHLIRNAIDHGIEAPQERRQAGKPELARLEIEASQSRGRLRVEVRDDGRGVAMEQVLERALSRGLLSAARASSLTPEETLEFIFLPGFSTAQVMSDISGRGVGLDVVRSTLEQIGGSVRIQSRWGAGTTFFLEAPLTRSVIRCLLVRIAAGVYAVPLSRVDRVLRPSSADLRSLEGRDYLEVDGRNVPLVQAAEVLGLAARYPQEGSGVLVMSGAEGPCALHVEAFLGEEDLVLRRLDPRLQGVENIMAASTLQDGKLVLILDVDDVLLGVNAQLATGRPKVSRRPEAPGRRRVLVVDDSITVREAERQLLTSRGYEVDVAIDGMDGWNMARSGAYDLVISDIDMPRMTGIELVKKLKSDEKLAQIPVVIVSYKDREEDRLQGLQAGADAYIKKSAFDDQVLLKVVHDFIGGPLT
jgi:two-component system sensor histidine kinase and response regulator WspE